MRSREPRLPPKIRQWRKNRAPANCSGFTALSKEVCCEGVDLNRNYDLGFSQENYPFNNPCSDEFQGPYPFSEPETSYTPCRVYTLSLLRARNQYLLLEQCVTS
ncbi:hypothetical protein OESDEN_17498 [Oesophagostomum dentatum]|uniref:Peptidase M14 domain-containing protein n=1 Tax=Oesophagostomum dentatum TaxID=61180 RepID=A0A0B1SGY0_OESDE|nr:hypothetical protein OESDEN_17498 [Oesophagostomum dentatum]